MPTLAAVRRPSAPGPWFDSTRLAAIVRWWLDSDEGRDLRTLSERSSVPPRRIYGILHAESRYSSLDVTDRLLVAMGCGFFFHLPPDEGGSADVYKEAVDDAR